MTAQNEAEQVGTIYALWFCLIFVLSLPLMAVAYLLGVIGFLLHMSAWAGYTQSKAFPVKRKWDDE